MFCRRDSSAQHPSRSPPHGRVPAIRLVAGVGFVASAAAFVLTFVGPAGFTGLDSVSYAILVAVVVLVLGLPPLVLYGMRKPGWGPAFGRRAEHGYVRCASESLEY